MGWPLTSGFLDMAENIRMGWNTVQKLILNIHNAVCQLCLKKEEETDINIWELDKDDNEGGRETAQLNIKNMASTEQLCKKKKKKKAKYVCVRKTRRVFRSMGCLIKKLKIL